MKEKVTLLDIAQEAGVSPSSVSRVINGKPGVNRQVRATIQKLLEKYDCVSPKVTADRDRSPLQVVGVLLADIQTVQYTEGAYFVQSNLTAQGYCGVVFNAVTALRSYQELDSLFRIVESYHIASLVMLGSQFQNDDVAALIDRYFSQIPVVMINGYLNMPNVYGIISDDIQNMLLCVQHLLKNGKKHIGFVNVSSNTPSNLQKDNGFQSAVKMCTPELLESQRFEAENSSQGGYHATLDILQNHPDIDGIIYATDIMAAGGIRALRQEGVSIPEKIAVMGIGNDDCCEACSPMLTSLDTKLQEAGIVAAHIILDCLQKRKTSKHIAVLPNLVVRESTKQV